MEGSQNPIQRMQDVGRGWGCAQSAFSFRGALGWNTDSARTNSSKSITSLRLESNTWNTRSVNRFSLPCSLNSASANSSLWMSPSCRGNRVACQCS